MNAHDRWVRFISKWRPMAIRGESLAMSNVAVAYRILGNPTRAFMWFKRAADANDGDALVDAGYCYQTGYGVRRNLMLAEKAYRAALESPFITQCGREEAMYYLAVLVIHSKRPKAQGTATTLLRRANKDGDYAQAWDLMEKLQLGKPSEICMCRRCLKRSIAKLKCPIHRKTNA